MRYIQIEERSKGSKKGEKNKKEKEGKKEKETKQGHILLKLFGSCNGIQG